MKIFTFTALLAALPAVAVGRTLRDMQEQVSPGVFEDDCSVNKVGACCCDLSPDKYCIIEDNKYKCRPANYVFCYKDDFNPFALPWCTGITAVMSAASGKCTRCPKK